MKTYGGVNVQIHVFLTSSLVGSEWSVSFPGCFTPGERAPDTYWIGAWVGPRAGLDDVGLKLQPLGRPALSQSLYLLSYPGSLFVRSWCEGTPLCEVRKAMGSVELALLNTLRMKYHHVISLWCQRNLRDNPRALVSTLRALYLGFYAGRFGPDILFRKR
jgi:hypothetical protein